MWYNNLELLNLERMFMMFVIVGLGNPGKQYVGTRHNIGFETIDYFAYKNNISMNKVKHKAVIGEGIIHDNKIILVKPQTFMNLSGHSVADIFYFYKLDPQKLIVIYDDVDIDTGKLRIRPHGSSGTHNGMKSIIYDIQTDKFPRIRMGVGKPQFGDLSSYVLGKFSKEDREFMDVAVENGVEAVKCIIKEGIDSAMNRYNG